MANRTYEYNPTGGSPVINVTAGAELKTAVAVLLTKGDDITVQIRNQGMWAAGAKIEAGDFLAVDAEGLCQKATTGQYILAMALTPATAKGDIVNVAIIHAGYEA